MVTGHDTTRRGGLPIGDVLLSAIAAVSWAFIGMAGVAALGLHLLEADSAGSLGPMTAAVVALGVGGRVTPSGDVSAFGLGGAQAHTAIDVAPLGVGLVGAVLLSWFFLRSLRAAGVEIAPGELVARAGSVVVLFLAMLGGLAWAGHDLITIDGSKLGLNDIPGAGGLPSGIKDKLPGGIGGLLPDRLGDLVHAKASIGFTVQTGATLLGGAAFVIGVLLIALLASRRTPLPRALAPVHRVVRPAASALVAVLLVAVLAGLAAAVYAMIGDDHPKRIAGAALLGAPNGVWLGVPLGLFVPWDGHATGELAKLLPDPLEELLKVSSDRPLTLGRLAELDGRVWLLAVAAALMMLFAGVLTAVRTPRPPGQGVPGFAGRCALRLGVVTALALPLLVWLTDVSADASLSVLGFDAFGAGIELHGNLGMALLLGAAWGAGAGALGAFLASASGAAGSRVSPLAAATGGAAGPQDPSPESAGPYRTSRPYRPSNADTNPYLNPYDSRQYEENPYGQDAYSPDARGRDAYSRDAQGGDAYGKDLHGGDAYGGDPHGRDAHGKDPHGRNAYGRDLHDEVPYGDDPHGDDPHGEDPYGRESRRQGPVDDRSRDGVTGAPTVVGPLRPEPTSRPRDGGGDGSWPPPPPPAPTPPPPHSPGPTKDGRRRRRGDRDGR
ncbi:streptophobe family protein [Streptomyces sp. NPDC102467]|uniref:streptophobe family protein n=1 Tax=Streptomyces sp. NPDC102467 TaxID=3366179 RepID=UPI0038066E0A